MQVSISASLNLSKLRALADGLHGKVDDAVGYVAQAAANNVKQIIVEKDIVDTGALLGLIGPGIKVDDKSRDCERTVSDSVEYGIYLEFGHLTRRGLSPEWHGPQNWVPARPFMDPGVREACQSFAEVITEWVFNE
jgi:hypothetical protein